MGVSEAPSTKTPSVPPETLPPPPPPPQKVSKRKLYSVIGLIAIIAIASTLAVVFFMQTGEAITIPLGMNYSVGEKMTYNLTMSVSMSAPGMPSQTATATVTIQMEILSFDGTNYTINYTAEMHTPTRLSFSYTVKMNKTGYILEFTGLPSDAQQIYQSMVGIPGYGSYFAKEEMKVGESYQIPLNVSISGVNILGTVNYRISEAANKTFPHVGLYNVFRMDVWASNVQATVTSGGITMNMVMNLNGYAYMEYGTCIPIEVSIQETITASYMGQTMNMNMNMQMQLTEHNKT